MMNKLKPLGVLLVASFILGMYSLACADDLEMHKQMETSYEQVSEPLETPKEEPIEEPKTEPKQVSEWKSVGEYAITAYCPCETCCGQWADGVTADGSTAVEGVTIAASSEFEFGTVLRIDGHEYIVQDRGGAIQGNKLDIYFNNHSDALEWGVQTKEVEVKQ